ncbi:hypothetical protein EVAR_29015_1 [Eumeta japonica]|uniref:Uncharacterized protein n=1 Tax=Eumeta variegata TaxID=151549 RepID=A0A4C1W5B6_EUMVA|nr:hypothetical protein EVAR_29015_1 [Eumeta japonica]
MEGGRADEGAEGVWTTGTLPQWTECYRVNCYFTSVFYERVLLAPRRPPAHLDAAAKSATARLYHIKRATSFRDNTPLFVNPAAEPDEGFREVLASARRRRNERTPSATELNRIILIVKCFVKIIGSCYYVDLISSLPYQKEHPLTILYFRSKGPGRVAVIQRLNLGHWVAAIRSSSRLAESWSSVVPPRINRVSVSGTAHRTLCGAERNKALDGARGSSLVARRRAAPARAFRGSDRLTENEAALSKPY